MSELKIIQSEASLEQSLEQYFLPFEEKANEWMEKAKSITVTDASQTDLMESSREARLALRRIRLDVADTHKELKEESLRRGQLLDKIKRRLTELITPIEEQLENQEKFVERQEAKKKEELYQSRLKIALEVMGDHARTIALGDLDEMVFENMIEGYKLQAEKRKKEEEIKRKADEEERLRLKAENERLAKERAEKEAELAAERDKNRKEQEAIRKKAEVERMANEKKLEAERQARLKLEREEAERKAKEEEEKKRKAAEERKLKRGPDKSRLEAFIEELTEFKKRVPKMKDDEAQVIASNISDLLNKVDVYVKKQVEKL